MFGSNKFLGIENLVWLCMVHLYVIWIQIIVLVIIVIVLYKGACLSNFQLCKFGNKEKSYYPSDIELYLFIFCFKAKWSWLVLLCKQKRIGCNIQRCVCFIVVIFSSQVIYYCGYLLLTGYMSWGLRREIITKVFKSRCSQVLTNTLAGSAS